MTIVFKFRRLITLIAILNISLFSGCNSTSENESSEYSTEVPSNEQNVNADDGSSNNTDSAAINEEKNQNTENNIANNPPPPSVDENSNPPPPALEEKSTNTSSQPAENFTADDISNNPTPVEAKNDMNKGQSDVDINIDKNSAQDTASDGTKLVKNRPHRSGHRILLPYKVVQGDTLNKISKKIFGSSASWKNLVKSNNFRDPNKIYIGETIYYPLNSKSKSFAESYTGAPKVKLIVKKGDTLSSIANEVLGASSVWKLLWKENPKINDPDKIKIGQVVYYVPLKIKSKKQINPKKTLDKTTDKG